MLTVVSSNPGPVTIFFQVLRGLRFENGLVEPQPQSAAISAWIIVSDVPLNDSNLSLIPSFPRNLLHAPRTKYECRLRQCDEPWKLWLELLRHGIFCWSIDDVIWFSFVDERDWIVITKDKSQRLQPVEKTELQKHRIKQFAFQSGNLSASEMAMANLLKANLRKIFNLIRKHPPPFVASLTKSGVNPKTLSFQTEPPPRGEVLRVKKRPSATDDSCGRTGLISRLGSDGSGRAGAGESAGCVC